VVDHLQLASDSHQWNVNFIKAAQNLEMDFFTTFFDILYSIELKWGGENKLC
jgi:hypothetical protein